MPRRYRFFTLIVFLCIFGGFTLAVSAQDIVDDTCATLVLDAIETVETQCSEAEAGTACLANTGIEFTATSESKSTFENSGDTVPLLEIDTLRTLPINVEDETWGIAVLKLPSVSEDLEPTTLMMMGDVTLTNQSTNEGWIFSLVTQDQAETDCAGAPNSVAIQSPDGIALTINDALLNLAADTTVVIESRLDKRMRVMVVGGKASVTVLDETQTALSGKMIAVRLEGTVSRAAPSEPQDIDTAALQFLPFHTFTEVVEIPSGDRWVDTEIELEAGQAYILIGAELVKTNEELPWSSPEGHSAADCAAAGRGDWDCKCRTLPEWGTCTMNETASMVLVGRVGEEGSPFIVGSGGFFTAREDGTLRLGANDNFFEDNVGSYYAIIAVIDLDDYVEIEPVVTSGQ